MPLITSVAAALQKVHTQDTLLALFVWNVIIFILFVIINRFIGLKHYQLPPGDDQPSWGKSLFYTGITHFAFSPVVLPTDAIGRAIAGTHAFLSWVTLFWVIFTFPTNGQS